MGDRTAKAKLDVTEITESKFADDAALYTITRKAVESVAMKFVTIAAGWGLTVSLEKTNQWAALKLNTTGLYSWKMGQ